MKQSMYQLIMEKRMLDEKDGEVSELYFNDPFFHALCTQLSENAVKGYPVDENEYLLSCVVELCKLKNKLVEIKQVVR